jgi:hypothetical protein
MRAFFWIERRPLLRRGSRLVSRRRVSLAQRLLRNSTSRCALGTRTVLADCPVAPTKPERLLIASPACCHAAVTAFNASVVSASGEASGQSQWTWTQTVFGLGLCAHLLGYGQTRAHMDVLVACLCLCPLGLAAGSVRLVPKLQPRKPCI